MTKTLKILLSILVILTVVAFLFTGVELNDFKKLLIGEENVKVLFSIFIVAVVCFMFYSFSPGVQNDPVVEDSDTQARVVVAPVDDRNAFTIANGFTFGIGFGLGIFLVSTVIFFFMIAAGISILGGGTHSLNSKKTISDQEMILRAMRGL